MRGKRFKLIPFGVALICLGATLLAVGCSSGGSRFRFVLGSTGAPTTNVDVVVDNKTILTGIAFGVGGAYQGTSSGNHQFGIFQTGTTTNPFFNGTISLASGDTTLVSVNTFSTMAVTPFADNNTVPTSGNIKLRIIHASPTAGNVDVYIFQPPATISGDPQLSVQYKNASGYLSLAAGNYEIAMTQSGTLNPIQGLDSSYSFTAGQIRTIVVLDSPAGGGPYRQLVLNDLN
jgi:hypothetical protein